MEMQIRLMRRGLGCVAACALVLVFAAPAARASESASAVLTETSSGPGEFLASINLDDNGTTNIGSFWYSWEPGYDFMSDSPTNVQSPPGWSEQITNEGPTDGYAIEWINNSGPTLTPGHSLSGFTFNTDLTSDDLNSSPTNYAFVYQGSPEVPPDTSGAFLFVSVVTPEPASLCLLAATTLGLLARRRIS